MRRTVDSSQVRIQLRPLGNFANFLYPTCQCVSEEPVKAVCPFYLVSMSGEVKYPMQGVNV